MAPSEGTPLRQIAEHSSDKDHPFVTTTNLDHSPSTTVDCKFPTIVDLFDHQMTSGDADIHELLFPMVDGGSYKQLSNNDFSYVITTDQDNSIATMSDCDVPYDFLPC